MRLFSYAVLVLVLWGCTPSPESEVPRLAGKTLTAIRVSADRSFYHDLWFTGQTYRWDWGERRMLPDSTWLFLQTGWETGTYQVTHGERAVPSIAGTTVVEGWYLWFRTQKGSNPLYDDVSYSSPFSHEGNFYAFFGLNWHERGTVPKTIPSSGIGRSE